MVIKTKLSVCIPFENYILLRYDAAKKVLRDPTPVGRVLLVYDLLSLGQVPNYDGSGTEGQ